MAPFNLGGRLASVLLLSALAGSLIGVDLAMAQSRPSLDPGQELYEQGQYSEALVWLQTVLRQHQQRGDRLGEAATYNNLALVYSELGQWESANQAIQMGQSLVSGQSTSQAQIVLAQSLNTLGQLQLQQGQAEMAFETWQRAGQLFERLDQREGLLRSRINQAQALQNLGFYRRSLILLQDATTDLQKQGASLEKVNSLRSLGVAFREAGDRDQAEQSIQQSLGMAQQLGNADAIAQSLIALGNLDLIQGNHEAALVHYQQVASQGALPRTQLTAQLNGLRSLITLKRWDQAHQSWPGIREAIAISPATSTTVQAQLNLAQSLELLREQSPHASLSSLVVAQLLSEAQRNAKVLGDRRLESYALGRLGAIYEQGQQWDEAQRLTQQALALVDRQASGEVAYQWLWQLGRIAKGQGKMPEAIADYQSAVTLLGGLRQDLVSSNPDVQFDFQERVEPLYREYVSLLLSGPNPSAKDLETARQAMESLQLAELDNFFRAACLDVTPVIVDQVDQSAAVIYPILLKDKLAVVVRLPGQPLKLYLTPVARSRMDWVTDRLSESLQQPNSQSYLGYSQQLYDWLLRPAIADIQASGVETLVFIPDGDLRSIPMGVLHDGDRFVIEDYAVALTPGLQLLQAGVGERARSQVLIAGLTKAQGDFSALRNVGKEVQGIQSRLRHQAFLDEDFTQQNLEKAIEARSFPIMHLATHGQFSSDLNGTFLQAWGEKMDIDRLRGVLQDSELRHRSSLELLVLSACETALGDRRAVLGLAGISARSGAKSTLASLWKVDDEATAVLMEEFYKMLGDRSMNKAEVLQAAQLSILKDQKYGKHPYFWSAFIMVGSWH